MNFPRNSRRRRVTVQYQPAGAMLRFVGVFHAVFGAIFALIALTIIPYAGLFGVPFLLGGIFFLVNGVRMAAGKGPIGRKLDLEMEEEDDPDIDPLEGPTQPRRRPSPPPPQRYSAPSTTLDTKGRLEQLETLRKAGLVTDQEYAQKRQEILGGL